MALNITGSHLAGAKIPRDQLVHHFKQDLGALTLLNVQTRISFCLASTGKA